MYLLLFEDISTKVNFKRFALRKHTYSNIYKISPPKTEISDKNSDIFHISTRNIDFGYSLEPPRRIGSNEYL